MRVTRDVVSDLWPLYAAGEASADTRALVDEFLAGEPEFAQSLKTSIALPAVERPDPDAETRALRRTRDLVRGNSWLRGVRLAGIVFLLFAFGRIVSDTTWTASPRRFIGNLIAAAIAWTIYGFGLHYQRNRALKGG